VCIAKKEGIGGFNLLDACVMALPPDSNSFLRDFTSEGRERVAVACYAAVEAERKTLTEGKVVVQADLADVSTPGKMRKAAATFKAKAVVQGMLPSPLPGPAPIMARAMEPVEQGLVPLAAPATNPQVPNAQRPTPIKTKEPRVKNEVRPYNAPEPTEVVQIDVVDSASEFGEGNGGPMETGDSDDDAPIGAPATVCEVQEASNKPVDVPITTVRELQLAPEQGASKQMHKKPARIPRPRKSKVRDAIQRTQIGLAFPVAVAPAPQTA